MKERIRQLIEDYKSYLAKEKSKRGRYVLENVIEDLENVLRET